MTNTIESLNELEQAATESNFEEIKISPINESNV
jgi:hypothetical protein